MNHPLIIEISRKIKHPTPLPIAKEILEYCEGDEQKVNEIISRISKDEPWEYICGYIQFLNHKICLNNDVLIPRWETAELVNIAVSEIKNLSFNFQIIEIGTGSGCIAIAMSKALKKEIIATDINPKALEIAKKNVALNNARVNLIQANLLDFDIETDKPTVIIANLPYIPTQEIPNLEKSVKQYEPKQALDGGHDEGTNYYIRLLDDIERKNLNLYKGFFEIDKKNIKKLKEKIQAYPHNIQKDQANKERFLILG